MYMFDTGIYAYYFFCGGLILNDGLKEQFEFQHSIITATDLDMHFPG